MIADKRHKLLRGVHEALRVARGDFETIAGIKVHFGCGCVFCDMGLAPDADGFHRGRTREIKCSKEPS